MLKQEALRFTNGIDPKYQFRVPDFNDFFAKLDENQLSEVEGFIGQITNTTDFKYIKDDAASTAVIQKFG